VLVCLKFTNVPCVKSEINKKNRKMKTINLLLVALILVSCGQNAEPEKKKNTSAQKEEKEKPQVEEAKNEMPVFSSFWSEFFIVDNEIKFKEKSNITRRCDENGEIIQSEDGEIEPDYVVDESSKNVTVKVLKVEKDAKGIWVATVKSNDPSFPLKWYSDEKSVWHEGMMMHFPANPKKLSKSVDGQDVEIDFDPAKQTWYYREYAGDAVYIISFHKVFGMKSMTLLYDAVCEMNETILTKK
jgi:hypothetical protein